MNVDELGELLHLEDDLPGQLDAVVACLDAALAAKDNGELVGPAHRVLDAGGKRLRPVLALAATVAAGFPVDEGVVAAAACVELVHVGSLVHDDIMDHSQTRRGVPTVNAVEGPNTALLVGDYLLAIAGELAAGVNASVAGALATAIADLCDGQAVEGRWLHDPDKPLDAYWRTLEGKTAALLRTASSIGPLAAVAPTELVARMAEYGRCFGMAFQLIDDILDLTSDEATMGKPVGHDIAEGVYTFPLLDHLAREDGESGAVRGLLGPDMDAEAAAKVRAVLVASPSMERARSEVLRFNAEAVAALEGLDHPVARGLAELPTRYLEEMLGA
jgi:heptaprenyl diphosphate synthase/octaprenyl-diphosphate synthase